MDLRKLLSNAHKDPTLLIIIAFFGFLIGIAIFIVGHILVQEGIQEHKKQMRRLSSSYNINCNVYYREGDISDKEGSHSVDQIQLS